MRINVLFSIFHSCICIFDDSEIKIDFHCNSFPTQELAVRDLVADLLQGGTATTSSPSTSLFTGK
jgi:hypothetical protein